MSTETILASSPSEPTGSFNLPVDRQHLSLTSDVGWPPWCFNALVFATSVCVMALELTASRLIARTVGSSLYTWTSVIGIVLAGITLGNFLGGWMADRFDRRRTLAWMFLLGSVASASVLWMEPCMAPLSRPPMFNWPTWVLTFVAVIFLLPSIALGTISPVVASMALAGKSTVGATVGNVYAWGAIGSIVGTFMTGFYLIDVWGTRPVIGLTSAILGILAMLVVGQRRWIRNAILWGWLLPLGWIVLAATGTQQALILVSETMAKLISVAQNRDQALATQLRWASFGKDLGTRIHQVGLAFKLRDDRIGDYYDESNYSTIVVTEEIDDEGRLIKYLQLDKLIHSMYEPDNPTALHYEYEQVYAAVTKRAVKLSTERAAKASHHEERKRMSTASTGLFLGGGGFVFPRWFLQEFPDSPRIDVAELDEAVYKVSIQALGMNDVERQRIATTIGDARNFVDDRLRENRQRVAMSNPAINYDFIYGDAFNDFSIPAHLTTREFLHKVHDLLAADGVFLANIIDIFPRVEYPSTSAGVGEVDYTGPLPVTLAAGVVTRDEYQSAGSRLAPLEIKTIGTDEYRLRATRTISAADQERLANVELARSSKFNFLGNPRPSWMSVIETLGNQTRQQKLYRDVIPIELKVTSGKLRAWVPATSPWEGIEACRLKVGSDEGHVLGFRGIISLKVQHQLVQLAPDNQAWARAIQTGAEATRQPGPGRFIGRYVATAATVFPNIYLFSTSNSPPLGERETFVMVCSRSPLDLRELADTGDWMGGWFAALETIPGQSAFKLSGQMSAVLTLAEGQVLTDDFAPVDNLLTPVFSQQD